MPKPKGRQLSSGDSHAVKKDSDHEWHMIDSSIVKVHQDAMRSAYCKKTEHIGSSVGGLSTKIHAKVDALGRLLRIELSEGQRHESQMADRIFDGEACDYLLADRAYDSDYFI